MDGSAFRYLGCGILAILVVAMLVGMALPSVFRWAIGGVQYVVCR